MLRIPHTLLISAIGVIEDVRKCVTMDLKSMRRGSRAGGSGFGRGGRSGGDAPGDGEIDRRRESGGVPRCQRWRHRGRRGGDVHRFGIRECLPAVKFCRAEGAFGEKPGRYLIELAEGVLVDVARKQFTGAGQFTNSGRCRRCGNFGSSATSNACWKWGSKNCAAWRGTLDW